MSYYITTPLYYVNDFPHIGSAYPTIAADFIAGHMLQRGEEVCFLTGTDEHGQKIEKAAKSRGKAPKEHCDEIAQSFRDLWDLLDIQYDCFIRTSSEEHKEFVKEFFARVDTNGDIYKDKYTGLYCVGCEDFKLEKDLEEENGELICPAHKQPVQEYSQENYFFKLSNYQEKLEKYLSDNPDFIQPEYRRNEVLGWLKDGLRDFPISRMGLSWGIELPREDNSEGQKIYVWFDALLGYLSGLENSGLKEEFWPETGKIGSKNGNTPNTNNQKQITHIIGKDILRFHAVYWPAMLMSAGIDLPTKVFGHGFLTKDGMKMGKSLGNIIDPIDLSKKYGNDAVKFYFMRDLVFGKDGDFTEESFASRLNSDLANNLGNLLNRSLNLAHKYYDSKIPDGSFDSEIEKEFTQLEAFFLEKMDEINPYFALEALFAALNKVNAYINDNEPWKLLKASKLNEASDFIYTSIEACRRAAIFLAPLCPAISNNIMRQIGLLSDDEAINTKRKDLLRSKYLYKNLQDKIQSDRILSRQEPIFRKIEIEKSVK